MAMRVSNFDDFGDDDKILRLRDVEAIVGLNHSTIYRKISEGISRDSAFCTAPASVNHWRSLQSSIEAAPPTKVCEPHE